MPHPHWQIYAYPFLPKKLEMEMATAEEHRKEHGTCLFCDWMENERDEGKRVIFENDHFSVILPFFTEYPYGIYIISNAHKQYITEFNSEEKRALADAVCSAAGTLDNLFNYLFPYMMCMHNAPVNMGETGDYHFHIEFFPPMRSKEKLKFNASSETGAWAHCNPTAPEEKAAELRAAYQKYREKQV